MTDSPIFKEKMDISVEDHHKASASKLVSLIREFEVEIGKKRTHEIVSRWAERNSVEGVKEVVNGLDDAIESFEDVKGLLRGWIEDLNEKNLEEVEITEETETASTCIVDACIHAKVFRDLDAEDIGHLLYCKHDFAAAPAIHPKVALKRTKTLMEGDDVCDFIYYWSE